MANRAAEIQVYDLAKLSLGVEANTKNGRKDHEIDSFGYLEEKYR